MTQVPAQLHDAVRPTRKMLPDLTGLRFIAAFSVLLFHFQPFVRSPAPLNVLVPLGEASVGFFFILSGFILLYNYQDWFQQGVEKSQFVSFIQARIARIYPMYVVALLLATPVALILMINFGTLGFDAAELTPLALTSSWIANLFGLQVYVPSDIAAYFWNNPSWSVATEFFFYLSFPFFVAYLGRRTRSINSLLGLIALMFAIELLFLVFTTQLIVNHPSDRIFLHDFWNHRLPLSRLWEFFIGCTVGSLFYRTQQEHHPVHPLMRSLSDKRWRNVIVGLSLVAIVLLSRVALKVEFWAGADSWIGILTKEFQGHALYTIPFALLIGAIATGRTMISGLLSNQPMLLLGEASYSLYLIHWIPVMVINHLVVAGHPVSRVQAGLVMLCCIPMAIGFLKVVEMPARRILRRRWAM